MFTSNLRPEFFSDFASAVTLPCHATGVPKPEISWYRNTEPLSMQMGSRFDILDDGSLDIKSVAVEDAGMFQCLAKNEAGEQSMYTWLRVKSKWNGCIIVLLLCYQPVNFAFVYPQRISCLYLFLILQ